MYMPQPMVTIGDLEILKPLEVYLLCSALYNFTLVLLNHLVTSVSVSNNYMYHFAWTDQEKQGYN